MVLEIDVGIYRIESILSEKVALSPQWPHPSKAILSPQSSVELGVLNGSWTEGLGLFLEGGLSSCSSVFKDVYWE